MIGERKPQHILTGQDPCSLKIMCGLAKIYKKCSDFSVATWSECCWHIDAAVRMVTYSARAARVLDGLHYCSW